MANVVMTNPIGLDLHVQSLQTALYGKFKTLWGLTDTNYQSYGLCYRNNSKQGYTAEVYTSGKEYKAIDTLADTYSVLSFFGKGDRIQTGGIQHTTDVHLVMIVKLTALTGISTLAHRGATEARRQVYEYLKKSGFGFELQDETTGLDNVFREYPAILKGNNAHTMDMHPYHAFRFNMKCIYRPMSKGNSNI